MYSPTIFISYEILLTDAQIIVDRFAAHRDSAVHQENPLIAQNIWENCRPIRRSKRLGQGFDARKSILDMEQEWADSYALVCNSDVSIFTGGVTRANAKQGKVSHLQKLCIARLMHTSDGLTDQEPGSSQLHRDYVFAPTHSLHSELCMVLQARYFDLLDVNFTSATGLGNIAKEISAEEYNSRTTPWFGTLGHTYDPSRCVTVHEVAFAPIGDHTANCSMWFDALPVKLEQSQIKRLRRLKQKKKTNPRNENTRPNANGALICRTSAVADFPAGAPEIDPWVPMLVSISFVIGIFLPFCISLHTTNVCSRTFTLKSLLKTTTTVTSSSQPSWIIALTPLFSTTAHH